MSEDPKVESAEDAVDESAEVGSLALEEVELEVEEAQGPEPEEISIEADEDFGVKTDLAQAKEETASQVAKLLVWFFGISILLVLLGGLGVLGAGLGLNSEDPVATTKELLTSYMILIEGLGNFGTALFGSILGFILGYYFRKGK